MTSPADSLLRFLSRLQRLEALPRTGWLVSGVARPESVAAHVYEMTMVALWIADSIEEDVDTEQVLRMALLHDVGEALTSDIPKPVKELFGRDAFAEAERRATHIVLENTPARWVSDAEAYNATTTLEARIVKAADRIQMLARALAYEAAGAGDLRRFWAHEHPDYGIPLVRDLLDRLVELRAENGWYPADFD